MKKLMIAAVAVTVAAVTQAATISWGLDSYIVSEADTPVGSDVSVMFFDALGGSYSASQMATLLSTDSDWQTKLSAASKLGSGVSFAADDNAFSFAGTIDHDGTSGAAGKGVVNTYLVVFDDANVADATMFYMIDYGSHDISNAEATKGKITFGEGQEIVGTIGGTGWTKVASGDVPEPTSGLLLLLGMAGLALRRGRRA